MQLQMLQTFISSLLTQIDQTTLKCLKVVHA